MSRRIRNRVALSALVVSTAALVAGGAVFASIASAGSNGQQISLCSDTDGGTATISGINQNGERTTFEDASFNPIGCNPYHGYWWVGEVTIDFTTFADPNTGRASRSGSITCTVPQDNGTPPDTAGSFAECRIP